MEVLTIIGYGDLDNDAAYDEITLIKANEFTTVLLSDCRFNLLEVDGREILIYSPDVANYIEGIACELGQIKNRPAATEAVRELTLSTQQIS